MFTKVSSLSEIDLEKYGSFRLCYIDRIEEEIYNHPNSSDLRSSYQTWIPNPEYIEGEIDHYAFFTPVFDKQWGDDWNDAPYEHNAGFRKGAHQGDWHKKGPWSLLQNNKGTVPL